MINLIGQALDLRPRQQGNTLSLLAMFDAEDDPAFIGCFLRMLQPFPYRAKPVILCKFVESLNILIRRREVAFFFHGGLTANLEPLKFESFSPAFRTTSNMLEDSAPSRDEKQFDGLIPNSLVFKRLR